MFPILPINHLVNQYGEPTMPHKLATGKKPSVSNICVLFCPYVVQKVTAHVNRKALNVCHQPQNGFWGIFFVITQHQKGYLIYLPSTKNIISSHEVVFEEKIFIAFAYTPCLFSEALTTRPSVSYIPCAT